MIDNILTILLANALAEAANEEDEQEQNRIEPSLTPAKVLGDTELSIKVLEATAVTGSMQNDADNSVLCLYAAIATAIDIMKKYKESGTEVKLYGNENS